jgi:hypothetical protein
MTLAKHSTYATSAKALLLEQFKAEPNIEGLLDSFVGRAQEVEDGLWEIYSMTLDAAVGSQLDDVYGAIVGVTRGGSTDAEYILKIKAKIHQNLSSGTVDDLLMMIRHLVAVSIDLELIEHYPCEIEIWLTGGPVLDGSQIAELAADTKAAGVRLLLVYTLLGIAGTFTWDSATADTHWDAGAWAEADLGL